MRCVRLLRKKLNKRNIDEKNEMHLGLLSLGTLRSAEVKVLKNYERMEFKEEFLVPRGHKQEVEGKCRLFESMYWAIIMYDSIE